MDLHKLTQGLAALKAGLDDLDSQCIQQASQCMQLRQAVQQQQRHRQVWVTHRERGVACLGSCSSGLMVFQHESLVDGSLCTSCSLPGIQQTSLSSIVSALRGVLKVSHKQ